MGKKRKIHPKRTSPVAASATISSLPWLKPLMLYSFIGFIFLLPWLPMFPIINNQTRQFFWLLNFSFFFSLAALIGYVTGALRLPRSPYFLPIGIFVCIKTLSTVTSILPFRSVWGAYNIWSDGLVYLIAIVSVAFSLLSLELKEKEVKQVIGTVLLQAVFMAALTLGEGVNRGLFTAIVRPDSPLQNSDYFLSFGCLVLPFSVIWFFRIIKLRQGWKYWLPVSLSLLLLCGAMFISLPDGIQRMVLQTTVTEKKIESNDSVQDFLTNSSNNERWAEWDTGIRIGNKYPLLGSGPGTTQLAFLDLQREGYRFPGDEKGMTVAHPHNDLIEQYSQTGSLGLAAYLAVWITLTIMYVKKRTELSEENRFIARALFWGLVLFMIFNIFLFTTVFTGLIAATWIALLLHVLRVISWDELIVSTTVYKITLGIFTIVGLVIMVYAWKYQAADRASNRASATHVAKQTRQSVINSLDAVRIFPQEAYYNWQAGYYNLYAYAQPNNEITEAELPTLAQQAIYFSRESTSKDPYTPQYLLDRGLAEYFLAETSSKDEELGIANIHEAQVRSPMLYNIYLRTASFYAWKGNTGQALQQLEQALKHAPKNKIRFIKEAINELYK